MSGHRSNNERFVMLKRTMRSSDTNHSNNSYDKELDPLPTNDAMIESSHPFDRSEHKRRDDEDSDPSNWKSERKFVSSQLSNSDNINNNHAHTSHRPFHSQASLPPQHNQPHQQQPNATANPFSMHAPQSQRPPWLPNRPPAVDLPANAAIDSSASNVSNNNFSSNHTTNTAAPNSSQFNANTSRDSSADARNLRRRMASPNSNDPMAFENQAASSDFPSNPINAATEVRPQPSFANGTNTPNGNNVTHDFGSFGASNASNGNGHAFGNGTANGNPFASNGNGYNYSTKAEPGVQPIFNPFEQNGVRLESRSRSKRKYSDPDADVTGKRGAKIFGAPPAKFSVRGSMRAAVTWFTSSMRMMLSKMGRDSKKNDEMNATSNSNNHSNGVHKFGVTGEEGNQSNDDGHEFGSKQKSMLPGSGNGGKGLRGRRALIKNVLFFLFVTFTAICIYAWYTHDCDGESVESHDDFDAPEEYLVATISQDPESMLAEAHKGQGGHLASHHHASLNPATEPGGVVTNYLGHQLQEFEMKFPFIHPIVHFFKRPLSIKNAAHATTETFQEVIDTENQTPFTLVSLLRDMTPAFLQENKASYIFQYNALLSWVRLTPYVIIYMDTEASCRDITSRREFQAVQCFAIPCIHETIKRPLLNCIFNHAHSQAQTEAIGFVNGDIVLSTSVKHVINKVSSNFEKYLVVSRRTDTHLPDYLIDGFIQNYLSTANGATTSGTMVTNPISNTKVHIYDNVDITMEFSRRNGLLHSEFGIDLFIYPKSTFQWMFPNFPPFLAGVYRWDNYFLTKMILHPQVSTIDASEFGMIIHQQIDGGKDHSKRTGAPINDALVKQHLGSIYKLGHIKNVDYVLQEGKYVVPNANASVHVLYAKRANAAHWLSIIHVNAREHVELNNFICWANRISFSNFIFLTRDQEMYQEIMKRELPVIFLDRSLVDSAHTTLMRNLKKGADAGGIASDDEETAGSTLQRYEFLLSVLKAGYHFMYSSVRAVYLDDPLRALSSFDVTANAQSEEVADVTIRGNATFVSPIPFAGPIAVRSTNYGQFFWKQIHDCADMNKHIADPQQWIDCVSHNWRVLKGGVKKGFFDERYFSDSNTFFTEKYNLMNGYYPTMILDQGVHENVNKFQRLHDWGLMATKASTPLCIDDLPAQKKSQTFSPPTTQPEKDFRFKVRVLTFNRWLSLQRLLDALQVANYEGDSVDLEISIDYPGNMTDTEAIAEWTHTQLVARSFQWNHGKLEVIQQHTHIGLTGQWTQGWYPADDNKELMLFLEDDTGVSPYYYTWIKKMIQTYYLNPANYDPNMYGFALQTQHTILGETPESRYGTKEVPNLLNATWNHREYVHSHSGKSADTKIRESDTWYFRYQLVGTWGGLFFPQHWREFLIWLREKQFIHAQGVSASGFQPCVPTLTSNAWWMKKPHKVWSQWFVRFAFEKGWYNMYTNFPGRLSLVGNFREGGENFAKSKGLMNEMVDAINTPPGSPLFQHIHSPAEQTMPLPLSNVPLFDFHFHEVLQANTLHYRRKVWGKEANIAQCLTIVDTLKLKKEKENKLKNKLERMKKEAERKERESHQEDTSILANFAALEKTMAQLSKKGVKNNDPTIGMPVAPHVDDATHAASKASIDKAHAEAEAKKKAAGGDKKKDDKDAAKKKSDEKDKSKDKKKDDKKDDKDKKAAAKKDDKKKDDKKKDDKKKDDKKEKKEDKKDAKKKDESKDKDKKKSDNKEKDKGKDKSKEKEKEKEKEKAKEKVAPKEKKE